MENFITPAENNTSSTIAEHVDDKAELEKQARFNQYCDDTEVGAAGSSSLGRAAQPPPSEKSSTLDAKDAKLYEDIKEEYDHILNCPPGHSESAPSSAPTQLVTGIRKRRILQPTNTNVSDQATPPPLPPKPRPPPVPPRTYFTPPFKREPAGPPLPPRRYVDENEEAEALPRPTEVQGGVNDLLHLSLEAQDKKPVSIANIYPPTTVLLPNQHSSSSLGRTESSKCSNCENMKGVVRHMMNSNSNSNVNSSSSSGRCSCKSSKDIVRRHSK